MVSLEVNCYYQKNAIIDNKSKMKKCDNDTIMELILSFAQKNNLIRCVILNGSRASPSAESDMFQDYDLVYLVNEVEPFISDQSWISAFGEILIMQTPDLMDKKWSLNKHKFTFLILFKDWNRIDLTFQTPDTFLAKPLDSQSKLLLDKDNLFENFPIPSDKDYLPKPPSQKQFKDCCNEFLWVSTYVAKGLWRKQLIYAKHMAEQNVKEKLIELLVWHAGGNSQFGRSLGGYNKYLHQYLEPELWDKFCQTYVDADFEHIWEGLFKMFELFNDVALKIAQTYQFDFNQTEFDLVVAYLQKVKELSKGDDL